MKRVGNVVRCGARTCVHNFKGRKTNTHGSIVRVEGGHNVGMGCHRLGSCGCLRFPHYCRIVYIDTRKLKWCSIENVVFHSFKWPKDRRKAKRIARTLFANHCDWADVLIVRGRCFGFHRSCHHSNGIWFYFGIRPN